MDADPYCHSDYVHRIADRASAPDGGDSTIKDGEGLGPDGIHLVAAMPSKFLTDKRRVLRVHLEPSAVAQRDEPFRRADHIDEEHRRQHPPWRDAWAREPARIQRLERREISGQNGDDEFEDAFGMGETLEPMRAEVAQAKTTDQGVLDQCSGRFGEQHLPAMASLLDARAPDNVQARVPLSRPDRFPCMQADAHAYSPALWPEPCREGALARDRRGDCLRGAGEHHEERITLRIDFESLVRGKGTSQQPAVGGQYFRVSVSQVGR